MTDGEFMLAGAVIGAAVGFALGLIGWATGIADWWTSNVVLGGAL